jgi:hypothetical protein
MLSPPLRTAPPIGEAAKLTDDVTKITSYSAAIVVRSQSAEVLPDFRKYILYFGKL